MCELFGISSQSEYRINEYLKVFYNHSNEHPHGWGLACMDKNEVFIEKEPIQASRSHYLKKRLTVPIQAKNAFAHIRYATIGNVEYKNCHPYSVKDISGRRWTMVHNGTIFDFSPLDPYIRIQSGDTDSERILLYFVDQINQAIKEKGRVLDAKERFDILDSIIVKMSKGNKLNLLLYDGELYYVHTNYAYSLYELVRENQTLFSTVPLSLEEWRPVTFTTFLAYYQGKRVYEGTNHGNEYIDDKENLKFLYQIFSEL